MKRVDNTEYGFFELFADDGKVLIPNMEELEKPIEEQTRGSRVLLKMGSAQWIEVAQ